jgi:hypothetical protein
LVTLQKERYLETVQKNNANSSRERAVQFPRYGGAKPGENNPQAGTPAAAPTAPAAAGAPAGKP